MRIFRPTLLPDQIVPLPVSDGSAVIVDTEVYVRRSMKHHAWHRHPRTGDVVRVWDGIVVPLAREIMEAFGKDCEVRQVSRDRSDYRRCNLSVVPVRRRKPRSPLELAAEEMR